MKSFGSFIKYARNRCGLTQDKVAEKLNIVTPVLSRWENDKALPSLDLVCKLCNLLNVSIEECIAAEISDADRVLPPQVYSPRVLGATIKNLRIKNSWAQVEVGQKLFVTSQTVSKWEGGGVASLEVLGKLAELYCVSPTLLLTGIDGVVPAKRSLDKVAKKPEKLALKITALLLSVVIILGAACGLAAGLILKSKSGSVTPPDKTDEPEDVVTSVFISPLKQYYSFQSFAYDPLDGNYYSGLSFIADVGTEIYAVADGVIIRNGASQNEVVIKHNGGLTSRYFYLDEIGLEDGSAVKAGQVIGTISTAYAPFENALLHLKMSLNGEEVAPSDYIAELTDGEG